MSSLESYYCWFLIPLNSRKLVSVNIKYISFKSVRSQVFNFNYQYLTQETLTELNPDLRNRHHHTTTTLVENTYCNPEVRM